MPRRTPRPPAPPGPRRPLRRPLRQPLPTAGDPGYAAVCGITVEALTALLPRWIPAARPDWMLVHIGTNNMYGPDHTAAPGFLRTFVATLLRLAPSAGVLLASIIPSRLPEWQAHIDDYNRQVRAIAEESGHRGKVFFVDMAPALHASPQGGDDLSDLVHPGDQGYAKMAAVWRDALHARLPAPGGGPILNPNPHFRTPGSPRRYNGAGATPPPASRAGRTTARTPATGDSRASTTARTRWVCAPLPGSSASPPDSPPPPAARSASPSAPAPSARARTSAHPCTREGPSASRAAGTPGPPSPPPTTGAPGRTTSSPPARSPTSASPPGPAPARPPAPGPAEAPGHGCRGTRDRLLSAVWRTPARHPAQPTSRTSTTSSWTVYTSQHHSPKAAARSGTCARRSSETAVMSMMISSCMSSGTSNSTSAAR
ncbi:GDSL-type esterase/lipase family protein [Streptomyces nogalater]